MVVGHLSEIFNSVGKERVDGEVKWSWETGMDLLMR